MSNINASLFLALSFALASAATAQTKAADSDTTLTLHGITIYGIVDIGLQYETHGATLSDYFSNGAIPCSRRTPTNRFSGPRPAT